MIKIDIILFVTFLDDNYFKQAKNCTKEVDKHFGQYKRYEQTLN